MTLTSEQRAAVEYEGGPLLIIAGAGTGKTLVITHRIAHLINTKKARPSEILALTFTDKAAQEMEGRVDLLVPYGYMDVWISTFHAFGDRVVRENALLLGLTPDFQVLDKAEQVIFFRGHLFDLPLRTLLPLGNPTRHIEAILTTLSRAKDEDVRPEEYCAFAKRLAEEARVTGDPEDLDRAAQQEEIAETYARYQELLVENGFVDFGDLVTLTLRLFREHPAVLRRYRDRFRYILVDEFQDTNYAQYQLVRLLASGHRNITVVGDDDQSIYKFRGAAISNILNFTRDYPDARRIVLQENFRSTQEILDSAYRLIRYNDPERLEVKEQVDKRLHAREKGEAVNHLHYDTLSSEADGVATMIEKKVREGLRYQDCAILVRSNHDATPFLQALNIKGIPYRFSGSRGLYFRPEVKLLISFLRVMGDCHESRSLYSLASSEIYQTPVRDLAHCMSLADRQKRSLYTVFSAVRDLAAAGEVSAEGEAAITKILQDIDHYLTQSRVLSSAQLLYEFLKGSGYLSSLMERSNEQGDVTLGNIAKFFGIVRRCEELHLVDRVHPFVRHLDLLIEAGDDPPVVEADPDIDAVTVMTVHKAKGLEFPVVFLVSLVDQKFPVRDRKESLEFPDALVKELLPGGDVHLQEERRLFYVGMTRAKKGLYLTSARDYGGARERKVSRFVLEALDLSPTKRLIPSKASPLEEISRFAPSPVPRGRAREPIPPDEGLHLSYYQIDDYVTCPLKYKYRHILQIPLYQHHTIVYGSAIHQAIAEYLRGKMEGRKMAREDLIRVFEGAWRSEGFLSREHEEQRLAKGREVLERFYEEEEGRDAPAYIEKEFSFVFEKNLITGRWDRIDEKDGVVIIDYKSSEVRDQKEADKKTRESLQLSLYALAYRERFGRLPDRVELRFVDSQITGRGVKTEEDCEKVRDRIREVAAGLRARDYTARPDYISCQYCAYREICPSSYRGESR